jgi:hypothetical protein
MLYKHVVFGQSIMEGVARRRAVSGQDASQELLWTYNIAEALAAAIYHVHCADWCAPGTNCTACGQVFGSSSQRINTVVNSFKSMYGQDADLDVPANIYATHDNGLKVCDEMTLIQ